VFEQLGGVTMENEMESRLENWGAAMRTGQVRRCCSGWAQLAVALRDSGRSDEHTGRPVDADDAWAIERAWARMANNEHKWALKYRYIMRMDDHRIRTKLHREHGRNIRGRSMSLFFSQAEINLRKALTIV
jgi:hypothetical protein